MATPFNTEITVRTANNFDTPEDVIAFVAMAVRNNVTVVNLLAKQDEDEDDSLISGLVYYRSDIAPIAPGYAGFDVLRTMIDAAHAHGIQVRAWIPQFHDQVAAKKHAEWQMRALVEGEIIPFSGSDPDHKEYFVNPLLPEVQVYERSIIKEVVGKYLVDGIMLDWIRFDKFNMDVSDFTRQKFETDFHIDPLTIDFANPNPDRDRWNSFRTDGIATYIRSVRNALPANFYLGVYIMPPTFVEDGQNAAKFNADVNSLAPMCYFIDWCFGVEWVWNTCLATAAQISGPAELIPTMDSQRTDEQYEQIFMHIRSEFPQIKTLNWFFHGHWTEKMMAHINTIIH